MRGTAPARWLLNCTTLGSRAAVPPHRLPNIDGLQHRAHFVDQGIREHLVEVELWFGKIERDVIARGVFTSVSDLKRKLMRYIRQYNKAPRTVKWKYADPSRHIGTRSVVTGH